MSRATKHWVIFALTTIGTGISLFAIAVYLMSTGWVERKYCSDAPVCDKYMCEDGYDNGSCERWQEYCGENPDDTECVVT